MAIGTTAAILGGAAIAAGAISGSQGADAAKDAANVQAASGKAAIKDQQQARAEARADVAPFREVGMTDLSGLGDLVTNPQAQAEFIQNNPFFDALATRAKNDLFANQAAKGKVGSGGTAEALQNSLLLLGSDLLNQNISQRQNLATLGANAAAQQATTTQNTANQISSLRTDIGNTQAAGIIGAQNAQTGALNNAVDTAGSLYMLCDARAKENIEHVGYLNNGLPVYVFNYKGRSDMVMNVMAQDVEQAMPEFVKEINGRKYVNMEVVTCH